MTMALRSGATAFVAANPVAITGMRRRMALWDTSATTPRSPAKSSGDTENMAIDMFGPLITRRHKARMDMLYGSD